MSIQSPLANERFVRTEVVRFEAVITSDDLLDLSQFRWSSDIDGYLGNGTTLDIVSLSAGEHQIELSGFERNQNISIRVFDDLWELYQAPLAQGEIDRILGDFTFNWKDGGGPNERWQPYFTFEFNQGSTDPSRVVAIAKLDVLRRQRFSEPLPFTKGKTIYDHLRADTNTINLYLDCRPFSAGGGSLNFPRNFSVWDGRFGGTTEDPDACKSPLSKNPTLWQNRLSIVVHEGRHNEPDDPGHVYCAAWSGGRVSSRDQQLENGSGFASAAMYSMWVYKYGLYEAPEIRQRALSFAVQLLNGLCSKPTPSNPKIQAILSELPVAAPVIEDAVVDKRGFLYLVDASSHRVQKYSIPTPLPVIRGAEFRPIPTPTPAPRPTPTPADGLAFVSEWGTEGSKDGQFRGPSGLAVDPSGEFLYVADTGNQRVQKFTTNGAFVAKWGFLGSGPGQFKEPSGIAVDPSGDFLFVADTGNHRVQKFRTSGDFVTQWGSEGSDVGQFKEPSAIAVDPDGLVYVLDTGNHRMQRFTGQGALAIPWGAADTSEVRLKQPIAIGVNRNGWVYMLDKGNPSVQVFNSAGLPTFAWGEAGVGDGEFREPSAIAIGPNAGTYVIDQATPRVQTFSSTGEFSNSWGFGAFRLPVSCAESISPEQGAILDNRRRDRPDGIVWDFDWSDCAGATKYHLYVIGGNATSPVIDNADIGTSSYRYVSDPGSYITVRNRYNWTWKVRAMVGGQWGEWTETRTFDVTSEDVDTGLAGLFSWWPANGDANDAVGRNHGNYRQSANITFEPGIAGLAFSFDGRADNVAIPDSLDINIGGPYTQRTIGLWFKATEDVGKRQILWQAWPEHLFRGWLPIR